MSQPKRILLVEANEDGTTGGSHHALVELVTHLDRRRFTPVALFYQHNTLEGALAGFEVHVWEDIRRREHPFHGPVGAFQQARGAVPAIARRARFLRRQRIDLVHLNNSPALGFEDWLPAARLLGLPCVAHARGEFWLTRRWIGRALMRRFDRVLPVSHLMADFARAAGLAAEKVVTVYDGIDRAALQRQVTRDSKEVRASLGVSDNAFLVIQVAHLRMWKGHDLVLEALARVAPRVRAGLRLLIVGSAPTGEQVWANALRAKVSTLGLGDQVLFLGARSDVPDLIHASDLLLHASTSPEPFGLVLLEAMALGTPVLASRLGGPVEILTPQSGATFDPRAPDELAAQLAALAADGPLRARLGAAARVRAEEFDISRTVQRVESVYQELLA